VDASDVIALVAATVAVTAVAFSWYDSRRKATFEHLRELEVRSLPLYTFDVNAACDRLLRARRDRQAVDKEGEQIIATLNALNLLAYAVEKHAVDEEMANTFVCNFARSAPFFTEFIRDYAEVTGDHLAWRYIPGYMKAIAPLNDPQRR
jgi:hypothetical protein